MKVLVATRSGHKLREIRKILKDVPGLDLVGPEEVGLPEEEEEDSIEVFETFEENAMAKARWFSARLGLPTLADDSGLVVDALDGAPGVRSKRFAPGGEQLEGEARDRANNEHLLQQLGDLDLARRTARYVCAAVLLRPDGETVVVRGEAEGLILGRPKGQGGFGYDPLFFDQELGQTFAEMKPEEKDLRSHRGKAFRALAERLRS